MSETKQEAKQEAKQELTRETAPEAGRSPLPATLMVLTFTTGLVDAVSFIGLGHVFTANMTGNIVFIAFALAGVSDLSAPRSLVSLGAFMIGAAVAGRLMRAMKGKTRGRWLTIAAAIEVALLLAAAACGVGYDYLQESPSSALYGLIVLTALAMGLRNATVLRLKEPDMKTTVLTLTITGIAADSSLAGGPNTRLARRALSVLALFLGAAVGAVLLRTMGAAVPLVVMAALVAGSTALYVRHPASNTPVA